MSIQNTSTSYYRATKVALSGVGLLIALGGAAADDAVLLRPEWMVGKKYTLKQSQQQSSKMAMGELQFDQAMTMEHAVSMAVRPAENGEKAIEMSFHSVKMKMNMMGQDMEYDSADPDSANPLLKAALGSVFEDGITMFYDKEDNFLRFKEKEEKGKGGLLGNMESMGFGEEEMKAMVESFMNQGFPKEPVNPGATWKSKYDMPMKQFGGLSIDLDYVYVGKEASPKNGVLPKITFAGKMNSDSSAGEGGEKKAVAVSFGDSSISGVIFFDPEKKMAAHSETDVDIKIFMNNGESKMEIPSKQKSTVELVSIEDIK